MLRFVQLSAIAMMLFGTSAAVPTLVSAKMQTNTDTTAAAEDPNDKTEHDRTFAETRRHMQLHSEWSKKTGKMNDK